MKGGARSISVPKDMKVCDVILAIGEKEGLSHPVWVITSEIRAKCTDMEFGEANAEYLSKLHVPFLQVMDWDRSWSTQK
uniref:Uncharacterized protein n=1 Tax=Marseillevirus LCMAC101 TaxID=2506602 RepID=A0A481YUK1_9VIRU|nr:MAG: hypothetical protein LCMAC101_07990 [Marseillevirus LCMAC101]